MSELSSFSLKVGRLLCGKVRDFLNQMQFVGYHITYLESSGWIEREFLIRGEEDAVEFARTTLTHWIRSLD